MPNTRKMAKLLSKSNQSQSRTQMVVREKANILTRTLKTDPACSNMKFRTLTNHNKLFPDTSQRLVVLPHVLKKKEKKLITWCQEWHAGQLQLDLPSAPFQHYFLYEYTIMKRGNKKFSPPRS